MVCGGLRWFSRFLTAHGHTDVLLSSQILVVVCGGLRWCVVVCGGLWWFAVVCGGLWWIAVVCLLVIPQKGKIRKMKMKLQLKSYHEVCDVHQLSGVFQLNLATLHASANVIRLQHEFHRHVATIFPPESLLSSNADRCE